MRVFISESSHGGNLAYSSRRAAASFNQTLEATAAAPGIMRVTINRTSSASAPPLVHGCASADRYARSPER